MKHFEIFSACLLNLVAAAPGLCAGDWMMNYQKGVTHWTSRQYQAALKDFTASINNGGSRFSGNYLNRAATYSKLGNWKACINDCNHGISMAPNVPTGYSSRGEAYMHLGQLKQATADLNQAITLDPNFAEPYYFRAQVNQKLGQKKQAASDFKKASSLGYVPEGTTVWKPPQMTDAELDKMIITAPPGLKEGLKDIGKEGLRDAIRRSN